MASGTILDKHIKIESGMVGGKPHVVGHRITVQNIVIWHEWVGLSADEIASTYHISIADVYAALAYFHDHRNEIESSIENDDAFVQELSRITPSKLPEKLRAWKG